MGAGSRGFAYDTNGSIKSITTGSDTGQITWTAFNKLLHLATNGPKRSNLGYSSSNSRVTQIRQEWDAGQSPQKRIPKKRPLTEDTHKTT